MSAAVGGGLTGAGGLDSASRRQQGGLDVQLEYSVSRLFEAGIATSTAKAYRSGQRRFLDFVRASGTSLYAVSKETLCRFAAYLETCHLAYSTINGYLSAVRHLLVCRRHDDVYARPLPGLSMYFAE